MRTVAHLLADAACRLAAGDAPRLEAELLLGCSMGRSRTWLAAHADELPDAEAVARFGQLLARRIAGEPLAYLLGTRGFWTLELSVGPGVLIPRAETELLVELALARIPPDSPAAIVDLGTGSGAIALALASERPRARIVAVEASRDALAIARHNRDALDLERVELREGDWFAPLQGERFALIVSNPPYLADGDPHLEQGDLRHEPPAALIAGADGLESLRRIVAGAPAHLEPGGWLLVEHGMEQGEAVRALFREAGFGEIETARDLEQRERATLGRIGGPGEPG